MANKNKKRIKQTHPGIQLSLTYLMNTIGQGMVLQAKDISIRCHRRPVTESPSQLPGLQLEIPKFYASWHTT